MNAGRVAEVESVVTSDGDGVTDRLRPGGRDQTSATHFVWLDLRSCPEDELNAHIEAALHHRLDGIVVADPTVLKDVPPTLRRVWFPFESPAEGEPTDPPANADLTVRSYADESPAPAKTSAHLVDVRDATTLQLACDLARSAPWTVMSFADPTKIPLEIVIAAANNASGHTVTVVHDLDEAAVVFGCLERGSDGIMMAASRIEDVAALAALREATLDRVPLTELLVDRIDHVGMGDRACLDTCSLLMEDEGLLVGSFSNGLVLTCSETHPLPYMPTRPFRVNAAAVHSYVLSSPERTNYISELRAGQELIAVRADGRARRVTLGRVKIEHRPLLSILASSREGRQVNIIVQDDWHVRLLGPGGHVYNVTELKPGDKLLGLLPDEARHVGMPIDEFCVER